MHVRDEVTAALKAEGFEGPRNGKLRRRVDSEWSQVVDVGLSSLFIPFVSLRHEEACRVRASLMGLTDDGWTGLVGAQVGYILGGTAVSWRSTGPVEDALGKIHDALMRITEFASLDRVLDAFAIKGAGSPGRYGEVTVAVLNGDSGEVERLLSDGEKYECRQPDAVCEQFRAFAQRARQMVA